MTIRLSISLPDELHRDLVELAELEHHSVASVARAILQDTVPKMMILNAYLSGQSSSPAVLAATDELSAALQRVADSFNLPDGKTPVL